MSVCHSIKNTMLYFKAHVMNSSNAAVKLAKCTGSQDNIKFAQKLLSIKNSNIIAQPYGTKSDNALFKNQMLTQRLRHFLSTQYPEHKTPLQEAKDRIQYGFPTDIKTINEDMQEQSLTKPFKRNYNIANYIVNTHKHGPIRGNFDDKLRIDLNKTENFY